MAYNPPDLLTAIDHNGFAILPDVIDDTTIESLVEDLDRLTLSGAVMRRNGQIFAIRDALNTMASVKKLADSHVIASLAQVIAGDNARAVRSLFFEKTFGTNWKVMWHQDLTITVRRRHDVKGFGQWTSKAGTIHVQPPASVLEKIVALRIHLDQADESNGALKVIPGSHRQGRLTQTQIETLARKTKPVMCRVSRGGVLAMRPLLLHSSSAGFRPSHRRVIHLEFSGEDLPGGLEWYGS